MHNKMRTNFQSSKFGNHIWLCLHCQDENNQHTSGDLLLNAKILFSHMCEYLPCRVYGSVVGATVCRVLPCDGLRWPNA